MKWPEVKVGTFLRLDSEPVRVEDEREYTQLTVAVKGRGVRERQKLLGSEIKTKQQYLARGGQFIFSRIDARNGAFGIVPDALDGAIVTTDFPTFTFDENRADPRFFTLYSSTNAFVEKCKTASRGVTNRKRLKEPQFLRIEIPLPPRPEQERIASILEHALARISEARHLHDSFSGEHRAFLSARARELAEGVPRQPMREVAPLVRRPITIKKTGLYSELGIRSFGRGTFHKPALTAEAVGTKRLFRIEPGDLLFSNVFAWEGAIAVARPEDSDRCGSHRFMTCLPHPEIATPEFLCFWFLSDEGMAHVRAASPGAAGRNRTLGLTKLAEIPVPVPPISLQQAFSRLCNQLESATSLQRDFPVELEALQSSLLDQAFSGNL